ncbi:MAG: hypothetical protein AAGK37_19390 [Pseudomonadota bacterium]
MFKRVWTAIVAGVVGAIAFMLGSWLESWGAERRAKEKIAEDLDEDRKERLEDGQDAVDQGAGNDPASELRDNDQRWGRLR